MSRSGAGRPPSLTLGFSCPHQATLWPRSPLPNTASHCSTAAGAPSAPLQKALTCRPVGEKTHSGRPPNLRAQPPRLQPHSPAHVTDGAALGACLSPFPRSPGTRPALLLTWASGLTLRRAEVCRL